MCLSTRGTALIDSLLEEDHVDDFGPGVAAVSVESAVEIQREDCRAVDHGLVLAVEGADPYQGVGAEGATTEALG